MRNTIGPMIRFRFLLPILFIIFSSIMFASPQNARAANADQALDDKRRKLHTLVQCLGLIKEAGVNRSVSTYPEVLSFNGLYVGEQEWVVVGLDRDSGNGVQTCETVIQAGAAAFDPASGEWQSWLLNELTGEPNFNGGKALTITEGRINGLIKRVTDAKNAIDKPSTELIAARFLPLVNACYSHKSTATSAGYAFQGAGAFFYERSEGEIREFLLNRLKVNKNSGSFTNTKTELGDIELGFFWDDKYTGGSFNTFESDFYPIGSDISQTSGYTNGAIVDCNFIKDNHSWILASITSVDQIPKLGGGPVDAGGGDGTHENNATCETSGNPLTWILCPVFNGIADTADWLFENLIQPFLYTPPIETKAGDPSFEIWSSFRLYGNIILIIAMLVIVFGQAIGGGIVDAYTARKVLPRILVAAILINLSVYIVNFMVDITNIVGNGLGSLMLEPLKRSGQLSFTPGAGQSISVVFWTGFLGLFTGGALVGGILGALAFGAGAFIAKAAIFIVLFVLIPFVLAIIGVFVTLILRKGIILLLLLVSPVAFALYCLPNTEQYFKKWWNLLFKTLMVYPIIIVIFAVADILSVTTLNAGGIQADANLAAQITNQTIASPLAAVVAFVLQFLPLFLIPFAFRLAGGAITAISGAITNGATKINGLTKTRKEYAKRDVHARMLEGRGDIYNRLQKTASNPNAGRRGLARFTRARIGGYNLEAALSAQRAERSKELTDQIATGDDDEIRALNTDRRLIKSSLGGVDALTRAGYTEGVHWRINEETGRLQLKNMSGKFYDAAESQAGLERWDGDRAALQRSVSYEIQKALVQDDNDSVASSFVGLQQSWGMNDEQMNAIMIGAGFEMQNKSKQWKRYTVKEGKLHLDGKGLADEQHANMGSYQGLAQDADTFVTMGAAYVAANGQRDSNPAAAASADKIKEFAQRFERMSESEIDAQVRSALQAQAQAGGTTYDPTSSASADSAKAIKELIETTRTGQVVAGGKIEKHIRNRNEVIAF